MLKRKWVLVVGGIGGVVVASLAFGVFGVQFLFIDDKIDEARPVVVTHASSPDSDSPDEESATDFEITDFVSRAHSTSGTAEIIQTADGPVVRFNELKTDNGPDLNVYLSKAATDDPDGAFDDDIVDLGNLKGNVGSQNYDVPGDVDLADYNSVVIWCVRFSVPFGAAPISLA